MRYSEALVLEPGLRAVTVTPQSLAEVRQEILEVLHRWSPAVEVCPFDQGGFWVSAGGLGALYGSESAWGASLREALADRNLRAVVVVGWTREGTYILARSRRRSAVVRTVQAEEAALSRAPLKAFPLALRPRRLLDRLGIRTWADLTRIPAGDLIRRFGPDLAAEVRRLRDWSTLPLQTPEVREPWTGERRFDSPVTDRNLLALELLEPLNGVLAGLDARGRLASEWRLVLEFEDGPRAAEVLRPADPTLRRRTWQTLLELRLARLEFRSGVTGVRMAVLEVPLPPCSGDLFAPPPVRDKKRGGEALALVRARWGDSAAVRPVLVDRHLPEHSYQWEPILRPSGPQPKPPAPGEGAAVRRVPIQRGSLGSSPAGQRFVGPCIFTLDTPEGPVDREYWFLRTVRKEVHWVSWDRLEKKAVWEGVVD